MSLLPVNMQSEQKPPDDSALSRLVSHAPPGSSRLSTRVPSDGSATPKVQLPPPDKSLRRVTIDAPPSPDVDNDVYSSANRFLGSTSAPWAPPSFGQRDFAPVHLPRRPSASWSRRGNSSQSVAVARRSSDPPEYLSEGLYAETRCVETGGNPHISPRWDRSRPYMQPLYTNSATAALGNYSESPYYRYGPHYGGDTPARLGTASLSEFAISTSATDQNWPDLLRYCQKFDEEMLSNWDGEIDTLLVFAGLFSAVLTGLVVESHKMLRREADQVSMNTLLVISSQLQALAAGAPPVDSAESGEGPSWAALLANTLWFLSLIAALTSAYLGILLKQAFREYRGWTSVPRPLEALRLRQMRFGAFGKWQVASVAAATPAFLSISVQMFMVGLPIFLSEFNVTITITITVFVAIFIFFSTSVIVLPAFIPTMPFKSPESWGFWALKRGVFRMFMPIQDYIRDKLMPVKTPGKGALVAEEKENTRLDMSWRDRDIKLAKKHQQQYLWDLMKWYCDRWHDHALARAVSACTSDLLYGRHRQEKHYSDAVNSIPVMLDQPTPEMWRVLLGTCDVSAVVTAHLYPGSPTVDKDQAEQLRERISDVPWKLLALIADELFAGLHTAIMDDFASIGAEDPRKVCVIYAFCFLECLFEPAANAGLEISYAESWLALFCNVCRKPVVYVDLGIHPKSGEPWTLEDILIPWLQSDARQLPRLSRDGTLRLLRLIRDKFPTDSAQFTWNAYALERFSTLSAQALRTAMAGSEYQPDGSTVDNAVSRIFDTIESAIDFSVANGVQNCGLDEFPWLHEMLSFLPYISPECREQIRMGFKNKVFTTNHRAARESLLSGLEAYHPKAQAPSDDDGSLDEKRRSSSTTRPPQHYPQRQNDLPPILIQPTPIVASVQTSPPILTEGTLSSSPVSASAVTSVHTDPGRDQEEPHDQGSHFARTRGARRHGTGLNPILVHDIQVDFSAPVLAPFVVVNGARTPVSADVLAQAVSHPPRKHIQIDIALNTEPLSVVVTPCFRTTALESACVSIGDVLVTVHAQLQAPPSGVDWSRMLTSQRLTVEAVHTYRCERHRLSTALEPVRTIDCLEFKTLFAGLVPSGEEPGLDHMELVLRPDLPGIVTRPPSPSAHSAPIAPTAPSGPAPSGHPHAHDRADDGTLLAHPHLERSQHSTG